MATWGEFEAAEPEFAGRVRRLFEAQKHLTIATLRRDGSPRISGTEVTFRAGELWLGSMARAVKALDLRRDPRFALHSASADPPGWTGDAKLAGRALEVSDPAVIARINGAQHTGSHLFRCDITELVVVALGDPADHLVIESWHAGRGVQTRTRT